MQTTITMYKIMTCLGKRTRFLPWDTRCRIDANRPRRLRRPQHCSWMSLSLADIAAKHSSICRRISILFRQQSRHATAPNTTTSMTDVPCYHTVIITTTLVFDEILGIYPTVEGCGVPDHLTKTSLILLRHRRMDSTRYVLPFGTTTFWSSGS